MSLPSIRSRLSRILLKASLVWGAMVVLLIGLLSQRAVNALLDGTMQEATEILYALVQPLAADNEGTIRVMPPSPHDEQLVWQLISGQGRMQARSVMSPAEPLSSGPAAGFSDHVLPDGRAWRVYSIAVDNDGSMLHVAQTMDDRRHEQLRVALVSLCAALGVGLVATVWLGRRVRIELEPLVRLSEAVRRLDPLAVASLPPATRDELVPLRDAVIELGERLSRLLANERAFIAHAAHTLRTPLAGMDAQLAAAIQECPPQGLSRLQRTREALARLNRVVLALLNMFRSGTDLNLQPIDLLTLLARLPFEGLSLTVVQELTLVADPDLMTAALLNLIENASRHGARQVTLEVRAVGADLLLRIRDDGSGFETERLPAMQQAIDSQDYTRGKGLGLGLMLADLVARAHGGRLRLLAGPAGATVEIVLRNAALAAGRSPARSQVASMSMSSARDAPMKAGETSASITKVGMPPR